MSINWESFLLNKPKEGRIRVGTSTNPGMERRWAWCTPRPQLQRTALSGLYFTGRFWNCLVPQELDTAGPWRFDAVRERHATGRWTVAGRRQLDSLYGHSAMRKVIHHLPAANVSLLPLQLRLLLISTTITTSPPIQILCIHPLTFLFTRQVISEVVCSPIVLSPSIRSSCKSLSPFSYRFLELIHNR